jgi:hypothetical protein
VGAGQRDERSTAATEGAWKVISNGRRNSIIFSLGNDLRVHHRSRRPRVSVRRVQRRSVLPREGHLAGVLRHGAFSAPGEVCVVPSTPGTEVTPLTATELTTTSATVAGQRASVSPVKADHHAREDSLVGRALYVMGYIMDAAKLYGEYYDTTATALFSSVTATVGPTGQSLAIPTLVAAVASQRTEQGARRERHLAPRQPAQAAAAGAGRVRRDRVADVLSAQRHGRPVRRLLHGLRSLGVRSQPDVDRRSPRRDLVSRSRVLGRSRYVIKRPPSSLTETNILNDSNRWASFARVGFGIIANNFSTSIRSVNA